MLWIANTIGCCIGAIIGVFVGHDLVRRFDKAKTVTIKVPRIEDFPNVQKLQNPEMISGRPTGC